MLDISLRVAEGEIRLDRIGRRSDEEIITALTAAWGIGPWTAQMFLMFTLGRLDVWPVGDYGVRVGFGKAWGMAEAPSEREMVELGAPFVGGRSVLAWYCWRAADTQSAKS
jgi:3-methyladenine DNA glycosylase/8-oxoguanine DNA glycosylase